MNLDIIRRRPLIHSFELISSTNDDANEWRFDFFETRCELRMSFHPRWLCVNRLYSRPVSREPLELIESLPRFRGDGANGTGHQASQRRKCSFQGYAHLIGAVVTWKAPHEEIMAKTKSHSIRECGHIISGACCNGGSVWPWSRRSACPEFSLIPSTSLESQTFPELEVKH